MENYEQKALMLETELKSSKQEAKKCEKEKCLLNDKLLELEVKYKKLKELHETNYNNNNNNLSSVITTTNTHYNNIYNVIINH